ncbi:MAG: nitrous oxide reductase family maturation protein NosD, partial [Promethearchaeota archaeon]
IDDNDPKFNWSVAKDAGICTGYGTYSEPYIIEDLEIDGNNLENCIWIESSDVYFIIRNCTTYNSGTGYEELAGIKLSYVSNGQLINNNCSFNNRGIFLYAYSSNITISGNTLNNNRYEGIMLYANCYDNRVSGNTASNNDGDGIQLTTSCYNNLISGNIVNNNDGYGIHLYINCYNNMISGNTASNNYWHGIYLHKADNNNISGNTINYNQYGIYLEWSNYTTVSGNQFRGNDKCWVEVNCEDNVFEDNNCVSPLASPGYGIFFLIGIISITSIILILLKRRRQSKS